ncbi:MAG: saccharopine dehydrogenase NADP-binding domain-containing protein, partial [Myxococcales bacterium]|nr:saccharopine dehydrogenase NADP-binding domain-containing protein [Myxococcales bacterium]
MEKKPSGRIVVVGGYGVAGSALVAELVDTTEAEIVIAGRDRSVAETAASRFPDRAVAAVCDADDEGSVGQVLEGADAVVHAAGPFDDRFPTVANVAADLGVHYIDISDSRDFFLTVRKAMDDREGLTAAVLCGLGATPGMTSMMARVAAEGYDSVEEIHIAVYRGGATPKGPAFVRSLVRTLPLDFPVLVNGGHHLSRAMTEWELIQFPEGFGKQWVYLTNAPDYEVMYRQFGLSTLKVKVGFEPHGFDRILRAFAIAAPLWQGRREEAVTNFAHRYASNAGGSVDGDAIMLRLYGRRAGLTDSTTLSISNRSGGRLLSIMPAAIAARAALAGELRRRGWG